MVHDLLTLTAGLTYGISYKTHVDEAYRKAFRKHFVGGSYGNLMISLGEWIKIIGTLPLDFSPGTHWQYSIATDVLGLLIQRASGTSFETFLSDKIFKPLQMMDSGFYCPKNKLDRLATCYEYAEKNRLTLNDSAKDTRFLKEKTHFMDGGGGLLSAISDYYKFCLMLREKGTIGPHRLIGRKTHQLMTLNHLPNNTDINSYSYLNMSEQVRQGMEFGTLCI